MGALCIADPAMDDEGRYLSWGQYECEQCRTVFEKEQPGADMECPGCGALYNSGGQSLADPSQWGEETGEHPVDVANAFACYEGRAVLTCCSCLAVDVAARTDEYGREECPHCGSLALSAKSEWRWLADEQRQLKQELLDAQRQLDAARAEIAQLRQTEAP